jgi:hypothetical protein
MIRDGRYWARTSDPQLVELGARRSTMRYEGIVGHDLGHAYGDRARAGSPEGGPRPESLALAWARDTRGPGAANGGSRSFSGHRGGDRRLGGRDRGLGGRQRDHRPRRDALRKLEQPTSFAWSMASGRSCKGTGHSPSPTLKKLAGTRDARSSDCAEADVPSGMPC